MHTSFFPALMGALITYTRHKQHLLITSEHVSGQTFENCQLLCYTRHAQIIVVAYSAFDSRANRQHLTFPIEYQESEPVLVTVCSIEMCSRMMRYDNSQSNRFGKVRPTIQAPINLINHSLNPFKLGWNGCSNEGENMQLNLKIIRNVQKKTPLFFKLSL